MRDVGVIKYLLIIFFCLMLGILLFRKILLFPLEENINHSEGIYVFAAASLTDIMGKIALSFEKEYDIKVFLNLAGSDLLRFQIEQGAPCDVYLSAHPGNVNKLVHLGLVHPEKKSILMGNRLVVITSNDLNINISSLKELPHLVKDYLAIPQPDITPSGMYTKEALEYNGLWNLLEKSIVPTKDVRTALTLVERNDVGLGIVYNTDAQSSAQVKIIYNIPSSYHSPIQYIACLLNERAPEAHLFYKYLLGKKAKKIFMDSGFIEQN